MSSGDADLANEYLQQEGHANHTNHIDDLQVELRALEDLRTEAAQKRRNEAEKRRLAETGSMPHTTHCETLGLVRTLTQTRSHCSCEVYATRVGIRHLDEILSDGENTLHRSG